MIFIFYFDLYKIERRVNFGSSSVDGAEKILTLFIVYSIYIHIHIYILNLKERHLRFVVIREAEKGRYIFILFHIYIRSEGRHLRVVGGRNEEKARVSLLEVPPCTCLYLYYNHIIFILYLYSLQRGGKRVNAIYSTYQ